MKLAWKITIGAITIVAVLVFFSSFLMLSAPNIMAPAPPDPVPSPEPIPKPDPLHGVDKLLKKMDFGAIAFNAPEEMNIEDSHQIQLILSLNEATEHLKKAITEEGKKIGENIHVSDRMEARLSGYMFEITAVTPETQAVSKSDRTEWKWEIHPKKQGEHRLHLTLTALINVNGNSTPRAIRTFSEVIEVNVTTTQQIGIFVKNNWQWLWAAVLVPIAGWLWKRRKKQLTITSAGSKKRHSSFLVALLFAAADVRRWTKSSIVAAARGFWKKPIDYTRKHGHLLRPKRRNRTRIPTGTGRAAS